ncbi:hypothetical protein [Aestuariivirga sp.]|jgi:hypothetical protein|uniref:hypothetical protein n=1 Tax=Aestuariivirga sp. TaxID=2650926 RepID=UPI0037845EB3
MSRTHIDSALLKALARGFRWRNLLETGDFSTIPEIAKAENINPSYVSRVLGMTLMAPEIVEAILAGRQPEGLTMARSMRLFALRRAHGFITESSTDLPAEWITPCSSREPRNEFARKPEPTARFPAKSTTSSDPIRV